MPAALLPVNETERLKALHDLDVLDSAPEAEFDALVNVASLVCGVPYSLITLVDSDRQWFKASKGLPGVSETPRSISFCAHAILGDVVMEVPDATQDPRFSDNPLVMAEPHARFYAGAPVVLTDGSHVGTLCVIDRLPRELNANQREVLKSLAVAAARALEGRKAIRAQEKILHELHKSELLLDRTGTLASVGGWEIDLATGAIFWSKETRRIHGVPPDYVPVMDEAINFYAPEARPIIQAAVEAGMLSGKSWDLELPFIQFDGTPIWVRAVGIVEFESGKPARLVGAFQDVTARRLASDEARKTSLLLRNAIDIIDEAFVVYDPQDRLVLFNEKYAEMYARSAEAIVLGNTFEHIIRFGAERGQYAAAVGRVDAWVAERMLAHKSSNTTQLQKLDNGRYLRIVERKLPDGHIVGFRIDITDLMRATEAAQEASNAKGQFLANMSHEIRTPMNAILGMLTLLRKTQLTPQQADYASKGEGATRHLLGLINDILDFSKIEAGKLVLDCQPFDSGQLLQDLQVILATNLGVKPVTVHYEIDPALPKFLVGDALRLQQILINLGGNAIKFTPRGDVVISIQVAALTTNPERTVVLDLAIQDAGIGIAPENQARIFGGFTQAEASITRRFGGTGLGVAICQRLVSLMGGTLQVSSVLGQGSRFYFSVTLPYAEALQSDADGAGAQAKNQVTVHAQNSRPVEYSTATHSGEPRLAGMRLLLVEDNPNNQQVACELLQLEGAWVQVAGDGQQAVEAIETRQAAPTPFDLVLMDLQMPVMDGFTATHHIREVLGLKDLPIVAMTANALDSDRDACMAAGMNGHVGKPFDINHLVGVLRRLARPEWIRPGPTANRPTADAGDPHLTSAASQANPKLASSPTPSLPNEALQQAAQAAGVDLETALKRLGHNHALYERTLRQFVTDLHAMPAQLRAHQLARDATQAIRLLHTLKGLAATLGASALSTIAGEGEALLKNHIHKVRSRGQTDTHAASPELPAVVARTCVAIAQATPNLIALQVAMQTRLADSTTQAPLSDTTPVESGGTASAAAADTAKPLDSASLSLSLTALVDKLCNFDMDAVQLMASLKRQFGAAIQAQTSLTLEPLEAAIDALDFEQAQAHCRTLLTLTETPSP